MSLTEERLQILKMLEAGTITAEEAAKLLSALEADESARQESVNSGPKGKAAKWLRIRVTNQAGGKEKVSVNLPIRLVNVGMKLGTKFVPELHDLDPADIAEAIEEIKHGASGKIVEVDDENGEHVEIFVE
jgi:hypothetical protein